MTNEARSEVRKEVCTTKMKGTNGGKRGVTVEEDEWVGVDVRKGDPPPIRDLAEPFYLCLHRAESH